MRRRSGLAFVLGLFALALPRALREPSLPSADLNVRIDEHRASHILFRKNLLSVHVATLSGADARILVAFPAGDSGAALWFTSPKGQVGFEWTTMPHVPSGSTSGQTVRFAVTANQSELTLAQSVLGSLRFVRDWDVDRLKVSEIREKFEVTAPDRVMIQRPSLDGLTEYAVEVQVNGGTVRRSADGRLAFAGAGAKTELIFTVTSTEQPLTPLPPERILRPGALKTIDPREVQLFSFLLYKEKFLAGSWTYLTYFGRDTLLTLRFNMHALQPDAIESMLGAVIDRLREDGDVAHEEEIGDYASFRASRKEGGFSRKPRYDYRMIDDDFLLAPVLHAYVRDADPKRLHEFLERRTPDGRGYRDAILSNLALVEKRGAAFAKDPSWRNLIALPNGQPEGNWRDSQSGVAWGRYVYDVNVALVPAALTAARALLSNSDLVPRDEARLGALLSATQVWQDRSSDFFKVRIPRDVAEHAAERYVRGQALNSPPSPDRAVHFGGISLDDHGRVIPVMHSDEGFLLMFGDPPEDKLIEVADLVTRPFPYGLASDVGLLIANAAFADQKTQGNFTPQHYHGTVVWSWQQAMMAAALGRQLERADLSDGARKRLEAAETHVWSMITKTEKYRSAELWTWRAQNGVMNYVPFGQNAGDNTESNPNQGWSHAFIGVRPPPRFAKRKLASF